MRAANGSRPAAQAGPGAEVESRFAGLVSERAQGRFRYYRLQAAPLIEVDVWLNGYRAYMARQLDALGDVLDTLAEDKAPIKPPRRSRS